MIKKFVLAIAIMAMMTLGVYAQGCGAGGCGGSSFSYGYSYSTPTYYYSAPVTSYYSSGCVGPGCGTSRSYTRVATPDYVTRSRTVTRRRAFSGRPVYSVGVLHHGTVRYVPAPRVGFYYYGY